MNHIFDIKLDYTITKNYFITQIQVARVFYALYILL